MELVFRLAQIVKICGISVETYYLQLICSNVLSLMSEYK